MSPFAAAALWGPAAPPLESASGLEGGPRSPKPCPPRAPRLCGTPLPSSAPRPGAPRAPRPGPLPLPPARPPRPAPFRPLTLSLPPCPSRRAPEPLAPGSLPPFPTHSPGPLPRGSPLSPCQLSVRPPPLRSHPSGQAGQSGTPKPRVTGPVALTCTLVAGGRENGRECGLLLRKHSSANIARPACSRDIPLPWTVI